MAWSTREIADLAGTSLRAVRHYHEVGLLEEPERLPNGYKQYGVAHLVRLLRIKRLADLGLSLPQIAAMGEDDGHPEQALRTLDAELGATIERLQRIRVELGAILHRSAPTDLPPEFAPATNRRGLSDTDRSLVVVMSRVLGPRAVQGYADLLNDTPPGPADHEFDRLPPDADEAARIALAERLVPFARELRDRYPEVNDLTDAPHSAEFVKRSIGDTLRALYNPAQLDVMRRIHDLM
ncbi:MerR family transcriptional regulator [Glycomyces harbinensis]|uniref:DNA-binding transcriptional regulator, MerR family n=1 Tax=Glycomyces harbinensis TaxID=58114 RepID=A0A1G6XCG5_9ACTN|nr:MerR family transcriptional regulator [Glycomyces harbinensis]SDD74985.1 DNA-binding transcriptional regulator, MerR family [Glycomyces harbinensis]